MQVKLENLRKTFVDQVKGKKALKSVGNKNFQSNQKYDAEKNEIITNAVSNIDITIPSGKLVGLLGPSGCGKSTTLFMIAGLHEVSEGSVILGDRDMTEVVPEKRGLGLVFQNYALYPHMTVGDNIGFPLVNMKHKIKEGIENNKPKYAGFDNASAYIESTIQEMADLVGIGHLLDRKPKALSGGQQQRVAIARALSKKPEILLLDEPLSNLDARLRLQTREEIKRIQRETGVTTIFVTHDQEEAMSISDEIVVMNYGTVQQQGEPQEVYNNPTNKFVAEFLGNPPINFFDASIKDGKVFVGETILEKTDLADQKVTVGIRPEGFRIVEEKTEGVMELKLNDIEYVGRDCSLLLEHEGKKVTAIIDSSVIHLAEGKENILFTVKPQKIYIFDESGNRICNQDNVSSTNKLGDIK